MAKRNSDLFRELLTGDAGVAQLVEECYAPLLLLEPDHLDDVMFGIVARLSASLMKTYPELDVEDVSSYAIRASLEIHDRVLRAQHYWGGPGHG